MIVSLLIFKIIFTDSYLKIFYNLNFFPQLSPKAFRTDCITDYNNLVFSSLFSLSLLFNKFLVKKIFLLNKTF